MNNKKIPNQCDVVVIGGGPAGTIASGMLAMEGFDVVLLEKQLFPRNTVGESLIPHFWKFTDLIGASDAIKNENFISKSGGIINWKGKKRTVSFKSFGFDRPGLHVERDVFDAILLNRVRELGVSVFEEVSVLKVNTEAINSVTISYKDLLNDSVASITSKYVVDASGQQALIAKQEKIRDFDSNFGFQAIWGYFDQSDYYDSEASIFSFKDNRKHPPLTAIAELGDWGWSWNIILRNKASVGLILPQNKIRSFKEGGESLETRFEAYSRKIPMIGELLKNGKIIKNSVQSIRDYAYRSRKLAFGNCYLVGDSAAFVDPISSEGVPMSMYAGYLAAWSISNSFKKESRKSFYQQTYIQEYGKRLQIFKLLAYPSEVLPPNLLIDGKKIIKSFSTQEIRLILAQSKLTGRLNNVNELLGNLEICRDVLEVKNVD